MLNLIRPIRNNLQRFRLNIYTHDVVGLCDLIRFTPKKIIEAGIGTTDGVQSLEFLLNGAEGILFEPHPSFYNELKTDLTPYPNIQVLNKGIYKESGVVKFYEKWACTFIDEMYDYSGAKIQDDYTKDEKDSFFCAVDTIDNYDNGDIDLLCMDCESCEWFVLEKLKSRPTVIQIETHSFYSDYKPFNIEGIEDWFKNNNYRVMATNESDSIYVRNDYLSKLGKMEFVLQ